MMHVKRSYRECDVEPEEELADLESEVPETPPVESYVNSRIFYQSSCPFKGKYFKTSFLTGFKCRQCGNYSKHGTMSGYCFYHKRVKDANESCEFNTRNTYKNINMP